MKINRHRDGDAWTYDDPHEHSAALEAVLLFGFDLSVFDDWLLGPGWTDEARTAALALRQRFIDAHRVGNTDAVEAWAMLLAQTQRSNLREEFMHPLALLGKKNREAHRLSALHPRTLWPNDIKKIKAEYARRLSLGEQYGAIKALAAQYEVCTKTIGRHVKPKAKGT